MKIDPSCCHRLAGGFEHCGIVASGGMLYLQAIFEEGSMITAARIAQSVPGKQAEAVAFAKEVAAYLKSKHGLEMELKMQIAGPVGRIGWLAVFNSLADYETAWNKILADEGYHKIVAKAHGIFNPGHTHDSLWRSL
jgi:hypothetical protein